TEEKITPLDVELCKILYEVGDGEIEFTKAIETDEHVIVLAPKNSLGKIIGRSGATIRVISRKLGKQVRVVGSGDLKEMIYDFTSPAKVLGVNKVYKPDGSVSQRIRISARDKAKLRLNPEDITRLVSSLSKDEIEIVFE
ncbi:MAG: hypothetical protein ABH834_04385, partial [Candidatus Altiarchaeota archaeon]